MQWSGSGPMEPAEVAQARLFEEILQAQFTRLNERATRMARPLDRRGEPPRDVMNAYAHLGEIERLREALRVRFLSPGSDDRRGVNAARCTVPPRSGVA
jgi:hypothetical protein